MFPTVSQAGAAQVVATADTTREVSDEELIRMADANPVQVESDALHEFDAVLRAANGGLIDVSTPKEFERQMRFRIDRQGSHEFDNAWTEDERWQYMQAPDADKPGLVETKWRTFVETKYLDYLRGKAAQWDEATHRMSSAAGAANLIAGGTLLGMAAIGGAAALPVLAAAGESASTAGLTLGAKASTFAAAHPALATGGVLVGTVAYGVVAPPGAPDLPGPGDDFGRTAHSATTATATSSGANKTDELIDEAFEAALAARPRVPANVPRGPEELVVAFGRSDAGYMETAAQNAGRVALNIQDVYNVVRGNGEHFPIHQALERLYSSSEKAIYPMFSGHMVQEVLEGAAAKAAHFDVRNIAVTPKLSDARLANGARALDALPGFSKLDYHSSSEARQVIAHLASTGPGERNIDIFLQHAGGLTIIRKGSNVAEGAQLPPDLAALLPNITQPR